MQRSGSLELIYSDYSQGLVVADLDPDNAPMIAAAVWGVTGIAPTDPPRAHALAEWACRSQGGAPAVLYYWPATPEEPVIVPEPEVPTL